MEHLDGLLEEIVTHVREAVGVGALSSVPTSF